MLSQNVPTLSWAAMKSVACQKLSSARLVYRKALIRWCRQLRSQIKYISSSTNSNIVLHCMLHKTGSYCKVWFREPSMDSNIDMILMATRSGWQFNFQHRFQGNNEGTVWSTTVQMQRNIYGDGGLWTARPRSINQTLLSRDLEYSGAIICQLFQLSTLTSWYAWEILYIDRQDTSRFLQQMYKSLSFNSETRYRRII